MSDPVPIFDGLMVVTAKVGNITFVTRNIADIARTSVRLLDPLDSSA